MTSSTNADRPDVDALARQTGFTSDAVAAMMRSIAAGGGRMAQFDHPEFGGAGQWMRGGMLMIADFANRDLQQRVARLCDAISQHVPAEQRSSTASQQRQRQSAEGLAHVEEWRAPDAWWPASWGNPETSGAQNDMRYAWFADAHRLAIDRGGDVTFHDTGDHRIAGVSQQQGRDRTLAFTSQQGPVDLSELPVIPAAPDETPHAEREDALERPASNARPDAFETLEKLAALHARGILTHDEFATKKTELLGRL